MLIVFTIAFREFLEAFLIIGVFLGISRKLHLKREKEIILASSVGILISILLPFLVFVFGERAQIILTEENAEALEGYLMVFSGFFIAYVVFSLHNFFVLKRSKMILYAHEKIKKNIFDLSLFLTIVFFIVREGFEIALFTSSTSLFSTFIENVTGLFLALVSSSVLGLMSFVAYLKFPIGKVYKLTEYFIIFLGASFVKNGINELLEVYFNIHISRILPINLSFLPAKSTFLGHMISNIFGLEQNFSFIKLTIMLAYITAIYLLFFRKHARAPA